MPVLVHLNSDDPKDFEVDVKLSQLTEDVQRSIRQAIFEETGIEPDKQNVLFSTMKKGAEDIQKLTLPTDTALTPAHTNLKFAERYPEVFDMTLVHIENIGQWSHQDPRIAENRTRIITDAIEMAGEYIRKLLAELKQPRIATDALLNEFPLLREAMQQNEGLRGFLEIVPDSVSSPEAVTAVELECYDRIYRKIENDVRNLEGRTSDSSNLHALIFGSRMMDPPFYSDTHRSLQRVEFIVDKQADLCMLIKAQNRKGMFKLKPRSDLGVIDIPSKLPLLICEVDSHEARRDKTKMILQGIAASRQLSFILDQSMRKKNRILGLFVHHTLDVDLLLFHADDDYQVEIYQESYSLSGKKEALALARILFNYRDKLMEITGDHVKNSLNLLRKLFKDTNGLPSLTSERRKPSGKSKGKSNRSNTSNRSTAGQNQGLPTIPENDAEGLLLSDQVKSLLCPEKTLLYATEHKHVVTAKMSEPPFLVLGFIKLMNENELGAFEAIRKSGSPLLLNRIVLPTKVVELSGRSVAFLPYGGDPLAYSGRKQDGPSGHELEIAWDLLNIVAGLHEIHIAHLDIKPTNILWDTRSRSIRIIDFDSSEIIDPNGSRMIKGVSGTSGYVAPEAEMETDLEYDPFLADAFSCGQVIQEVISTGEATEGVRFIRDISELLGRENVVERWSITKATEVWENLVRKRQDRLHNSDASENESCLFDGKPSMSTVCVH